MNALVFFSPSSADHTLFPSLCVSAGESFDQAAEAAWSYWEAQDCIDVNSSLISQRLHGGSLLLAYILAVALVAIAILFPNAPVASLFPNAAGTQAPARRDSMLSLQMKEVLRDWNF